MKAIGSQILHIARIVICLMGNLEARPADGIDFETGIATQDGE